MKNLEQNVSKLLSYLSQEWFLKLLYISSILFLLLKFAIDSKIFSFDIPRFHIDGAFQTASTLYRIENGQTIGKDFFSYLGIGPVYILYPIFKLFGANLSSSVFSAYFIVSLISITGLAIIIKNIAEIKTFKLSFIISGITFILFRELNNPYFNQFLDFLLTPGNSLRPIRSGIVYIIVYLYVLNLYSDRISTLYKVINSSILLSIILLWSNDYAFVSTGILLIVTPFLIYGKIKTKIIQSTLISLGSIFLWISTLYFLTKDHIYELFKFNFIDVLNGQWWFFGTYERDTRIYNLWEIFSKFSLDTVDAYLLVMLFLTIYLQKKSLNHKTISTILIGCILFLGGATASIGGHYEHSYFVPLYSWVFFITIALVINFINSKLKIVKFKDFNFIKLLILISVTIVSYYFLNKSYNKSLRTIENVGNKSFYSKELGGYLKNEYLEYHNLAKDSADKVVLEEYWGLFSAISGSKSVWRVDSTIHALGEERDKAEKMVNTADFIITTRNDYSNWQSWSFSMNYWFYEKVIQNYKVKATSPSTVIWEKSPNQNAFSEAKCEVKKSNVIYLPGELPGIYEVRIDYKSSNSKKNIITLKNNIAVADLKGGTEKISINPSKNSSKFPVRVLKKNDEFSFKQHIENSGFKIESCTARKINVHQDILVKSEKNVLIEEN